MKSVNANVLRRTVMKYVWGMTFKCTSTTRAVRIPCANAQWLTVICYVTTQQELGFWDLQILWDVPQVVGVGNCLQKVWKFEVYLGEKAKLEVFILGYDPNQMTANVSGNFCSLQSLV